MTETHASARPAASADEETLDRELRLLIEGAAACPPPPALDDLARRLSEALAASPAARAAAEEADGAGPDVSA